MKTLPLPTAVPISVRFGLVHLWAAGAAVLVTALVLAALDRADTDAIKRQTTVLAALNLPEASRGVALQREIARLPRCLPVYGSSELSNFQPTRADLFFRAHPAAGFRVVVIGQPGDRCLHLLQELAALGDGVRGRKVAIFLSPTWFIAPVNSRRQEHMQRQFSREFSPLQTALLLLNPRLDATLKAAVADRLMEHADSVADSSELLARALAVRAADDTRLLEPLLAAQAAVSGWQDRWRTAQLAAARPAPPAPAELPDEGAVQWNEAFENLDQDLKQRGRSTPYSFDLPEGASPEFAGQPVNLSLYPHGNREFLARVDASTEWNDLDLLLRTIQRIGACALVVAQPFNGSVYDACRIDASARRRYYDRVHALAKARGVPSGDFSAFEGDRSFFSDLVHPSAKAWIYYDQLLDRFYHGQS